MIMREENRVQRGKVRNSCGHLMKPLWSRERDRGGSVPKDRIGEHSVAVDFEEQRAVPEPGHAQTRGDLSGLPSVERTLHGQRRTRDASLSACKKVPEHPRRKVALQGRSETRRVFEPAFAELRRSERALVAESFELGHRANLTIMSLVVKFVLCRFKK